MKKISKDELVKLKEYHDEFLICLLELQRYDLIAEGYKIAFIKLFNATKKQQDIIEKLILSFDLLKGDKNE